MGESSGFEESDSIDWNTEDELEIDNMSSSSSFSIAPAKAVAPGLGESSSCSNYPSSKLILHFVKMGFPEAMVIKVTKETGENDEDSILDALLTYQALESLPPEQGHESNTSSPESDCNVFVDVTNFDKSNVADKTNDEFSEDETTILCLVDMGYSPEEASLAIERCGRDIPIDELVDFIDAAHIAKQADVQMNELVQCRSHSKQADSPYVKDKKRKFEVDEMWKEGKRQQLQPVRRQRSTDEGVLQLPNPMIGFGVPSEQSHIVHRNIPEAAVGPPFFYYENVALTPRGVWKTIESFLYEIKPEFVDSKFFCAAARKRGYIHNLPIENRFPLLPLPPRTIFEALPGSKKWWPSWDKREQLNCILTCLGSAKLTERIRLAIQKSGDPPYPSVKKYVIEQCRKWNLVWVGRDKVAPLEPNEIEMLMGYPENHTRGLSRVERYTGLGNAFQVDTVAYHLSVLKDMYPGGMNILSLFSGIGGAEVALNRLGIPLKNVVSVEKSRACQDVLESWWTQTNQQGNLIHMNDVQEVTYEKLRQWIHSFGGFDLVIGGSPCNNLAGGNRRTRDGLQGTLQEQGIEDVLRSLCLFRFTLRDICQVTSLGAPLSSKPIELPV